MALTTLDGLVAAMAASTSQRRSWICDNGLGNSTALWYDHWFATHTWGLSATPATGAGELMDNTKAGAVPLSAPAGGNSLYLAEFDAQCTIESLLIMYDRLWQVGGLDQSSIALQTINGATMTRPDALGNDVEIWAVAQTAGNFYTPTFTLTYKNSGGATRSATTVLPGFAFHNQYAAIPLNLQAGDKSVSSVVSIQQSAGGTATLFCLVALRRLATLAIRGNNVSYIKDAIQLALPKVDTGACIGFMHANAGGGGHAIDARLAIVEG